VIQPQRTQSAFEARLCAALPYIVAVWVALIFLSLKFHFLDGFLATAWHGRMGFDFFAVPRGFINLVHGKSIYATRTCQWGPYSTWYPYHPATAVLVGSWLSLFKPWTAFWGFAAISVGILFYCARLVASLSREPLARRMCYAAFLLPLPVYLMIWNGQMHVLLVAAFSLILFDLARVSRDGGGPGKIRPALLAGILLSLFSKPLVILALPAIFAVKTCRRTLLWSAGIYAAVSALFLFAPFLNPQGIGFARLLDVVLHPENLFRFEVYRGVPLLTYRPEIAADNAIHWLNMRFRAGVSQPDHFEIMSLSAFFENLTGVALPKLLLNIPLLVIAGFSAAAFFAKEEARRARIALFTAMMAGLFFFLSYETVYEYHYAAALPSLAVMIALYSGEMGFSAKMAKWFCAAGALFFAPTSYFWLRNPAYGFHREITARLNDIYIAVFTGGHVYDWALPLIRWNRVLPAAAMFAFLIPLAWLAARDGERQ
jgi:hypothetical protein